MERQRGRVRPHGCARQDGNGPMSGRGGRAGRGRAGRGRSGESTPGVVVSMAIAHMIPSASGTIGTLIDIDETRAKEGVRSVSLSAFGVALCLGDTKVDQKVFACLQHW